MTASSLMHQLWRSFYGNNVTTALAFSFVLAACEEEPTRHITDSPEVDDITPGSATAAASSMSLPLPFMGTVSSSVPAFAVTQTGTGFDGQFLISNTNNNNAALYAVTTGNGAAAFIQNTKSSSTSPALRVRTGGRGRAGEFIVNNALSSSPALSVLTDGSGEAGKFEITKTSSPSFAIIAANAGGGGLFARITGKGTGGFFEILNVNNSNPSLHARTIGTGPALVADQSASSGSIAVFQSGGVNRARIDKVGKAFFNGGSQTGGADVAEAFEVEGSVKGYEPGDVLAISQVSDRTVQKSTEPYSTRVIGVYATKPGVLLTERDIEASLDNMVPVGVIGVIPTKVSAESGAIRRGDLLVSAQARGHAMRADP